MHAAGAAETIFLPDDNLITRRFGESKSKFQSLDVLARVWALN